MPQPQAAREVRGATGVAALYDEIGRSYSRTRREDPRVAAVIVDCLGEARTVVNVGAGTGSYEPSDREVVAVEPSAEMLRQRAVGSSPVVQAVAEALPFPDRSFDAALAILTVRPLPVPRVSSRESGGADPLR